MSKMSLTRRETVLALLVGRRCDRAAVPAFAQQAEWRQSYDAGARNAVARSHTPMLSPESLQATEAGDRRLSRSRRPRRLAAGPARRAAWASARAVRASSPCASA